MWFQQFKLLQASVQLHVEYSLVTNQTLHRFCQQFKRFSDECQLPIQYLNSVLRFSTNSECPRAAAKSCCCFINELLWLIFPYHFQLSSAVSPMSLQH